MEELVQLRRLLKAGPPRAGLVPQSGDPEHPVRWIRPRENKPEEGRFRQFDTHDQARRWWDEYPRPVVEDEAVYLSYLEGDFLPIIGDLRRGKELDRASMEVVRKLDDMVASTRLPEDMVVYRGGVVGDMGVGSEFMDRGFVAVSLNAEVAETFRGFIEGGVLMRIGAAKGTPAMAGDHTETELVLPRNLRFRVVGVSRGVVDLEVVLGEDRNGE